ncbi:hydrogenase nickel incorporation protein HypB [Candidatus Oscillochloris fontis]|uniref:hydrogenase nickel incorporation protein HypB n=1 Tax=Candidatus Oscillochloris fontis TaxID=2496868 RepID=UPI00101B61EE|nr:hydrogenase nickel incorporation protein HypB [Candidatus Oscillochloris fontis]
MSESPRLVEVRQNVLSKNDQLALELRQRFDQAGVRVINLLSSPGAGKTRLLEETLRQLGTRHRVAALVGDLATDNDARRLARSGAAVRQIETAGMCHLEADMVMGHLEGWHLADFDILFIENVGNLVCPTSYDLGEHGRVVLMAVTEGEDKPLKYPGTFQWANLVLLSKLDMAEAAEFDAAAAHTNIAAVHPGVPIIATSARTGTGMAEWLAWVEDL